LPGVVLSLLGVIAYGLLGEPIKALASLGVCAALFVLGVALTFKGWLGMGDVKLFVALALPVGAISLWSVAFILGIALLFWLIVSLATILGKLRLHSIPLGPAILGANLVCVGGILLTLTS
jgi:Flp pilus assembly protein protease CpaA